MVKKIKGGQIINNSETFEMFKTNITNLNAFIELRKLLIKGTFNYKFLSPVLFGSSANCLRNIIEFTNNLNSEKLYSIKFQLNPKADNLLIDDLNGALLNKLATKENNKPQYFTNYIDSFMTYTKKKDDKTFVFNEDLINILNETLDELNQIQNGNFKDDTFNIIYGVVLEDLNKNYIKVPINIQEQLPDTIKTFKSFINTYNLRELRLEATNQPSSIGIKFKEQFTNLFDELHKLGHNYGFIHNDAHHENLLIDHNNTTGIMSLKLIDYGRSEFDLTTIKIIQEDIYLINEKHNGIDITQILKDNIYKVNYLVQPPHLYKYLGHMFDIMTLCMTLITSIPNNNIISGQSNFIIRNLLYEDNVTFGFTAADNLPISELNKLLTYNGQGQFLHHIYVKKNYIDDTNSSSNIFKKALYWFVQYCNYLKVNSSNLGADQDAFGKDDADGNYVIDIANLMYNKFFHFTFQTIIFYKIKENIYNTMLLHMEDVYNTIWEKSGGANTFNNLLMEVYPNMPTSIQRSIKKIYPVEKSYKTIHSLSNKLKLLNTKILKKNKSGGVYEPSPPRNVKPTGNRPVNKAPPKRTTTANSTTTAQPTYSDNVATIGNSTNTANIKPQANNTLIQKKQNTLRKIINKQIIVSTTTTQDIITKQYDYGTKNDIDPSVNLAELTSETFIYKKFSLEPSKKIF
jgi:thiamine kinase-like enzyme